MKRDSSVTGIKGVGAQLAAKLAFLGIKAVGQLIEYYPRRYDDYSNIQTINQIKPGNVTIQADIKQVSSRYSQRGLHITEAAASDETGSVRLIWFNQPYRATSLKPGQQYYVSGEFGLKRQRLSIQNPSIELVSDFTLTTARILPVYRETRGLKSVQIRRMLKEILPVIESMPNRLPAWLQKAEKLSSRAEAIKQIHFPDSTRALLEAKRHLGFEEVFELTLAALLNKYELLQEKAVRIPFDEQLARSFVKELPFHLTPDQKRVVWQIYQDMERTQPMNRLVEGDVGSGKTVVATMAALMAMQHGYQAALMAPTEILARQHAETIFKLLQPVGLEGYTGLLVGSFRPKQKQLAHQRIATGEMRFLIGTNALIQEKVDMHKLGLVVIDEQHRFGVEQRKQLQAKAGHMPHVLSMTATPIPRSLALTLYGELDISIIGTKPANRQEIETKLITQNQRLEVYKTVDNELAAGRQAFVVCPLITESDMLQARSAEQVYKELNEGVLRHRRIGLLHGKLKPLEKDQIMQSFVNHTLDILVATTVIEVGVDVPNATVMIIETPERFGLAQIHQLRGRVGRSHYQGYCYLMLSDNEPPLPRLRMLEQSSDGFKLAEYDLELRGPGAIYGTMQHGQLDLRIAKLSDTKLIAVARKAAQKFIDRNEDLLKYPELAAKVKQARTVTNLN